MEHLPFYQALIISAMAELRTVKVFMVYCKVMHSGEGHIYVTLKKIFVGAVNKVSN